MHLVLSDGRFVQRVFAGHIRSREDLRKFVAEAERELDSHNPLLAELWEYETTQIKRRRPIPTEAEEMTATHERG